MKDVKTDLLIQYHTVCHANGLDTDEKRAILLNYGVESSRDLTATQLQELITRLSQEPNQWRKRVFAAIGAFLRNQHRVENPDVIKAIACRSAGYNSFNSIPVSRLRAIYYEFVRSNDTSNRTKMVQEELINQLKISN